MESDMVDWLQHLPATTIPLSLGERKSSSSTWNSVVVNTAQGSTKSL